MIAVGAIVAVFGLVFIANQFFGGDDETSTEAELAPVDGTDVTTPAEPDPTDPPVATVAADVAAEVPPQSIVSTEVVPEGCPPPEGTADQTQSFAEAPPFCLDPALAYTAVITTNVGVVRVDLDPELAPNTVNSFVYLARNDYFNDTTCHRIIQDSVVQCGDPTAIGTCGPGYTTDDELPPAGSYRVGSLAMANSGPDTQGSQFFIITGDSGVALPPQYSLFGQIPDDDIAVVEAMDSRGSLDSSGTPAQPVDLIDVHIDTAQA